MLYRQNGGGVGKGMELCEMTAITGRLRLHIQCSCAELSRCNPVNQPVDPSDLAPTLTPSIDVPSPAPPCILLLRVVH